MCSEPTILFDSTQKVVSGVRPKRTRTVRFGCLERHGKCSERTTLEFNRGRTRASDSLGCRPEVGFARAGIGSHCHRSCTNNPEEWRTPDPERSYRLGYCIEVAQCEPLFGMRQQGLV